MKKQLLFAGTILLFVASFTSCKKQDEATKPLKSKMIGKWQVNKIDITTAGAETVTKTYAASDYMDFKNNETDDVELSLGAERSLGTFNVTVGDVIYLNFTAKDLDCTLTTITENKFQFTGTVVGSNPKITETYYLSR
ncbi:hypothetical protein FA048_12300 [Pedobacter polaris]|uniref:Lipocalin-like domain-containing protein n=1 Tax=Pedobacter polaris TaxID=2571273 RepID=A0A4U1CJZ1_9SPHI|nr:hypothetical protein [Pedobacter polaris]TKC07940.1 hypothetical protein FA048_12300 [Pedobacter polaris]